MGSIICNKSQARVSIRVRDNHTSNAYCVNAQRQINTWRVPMKKNWYMVTDENYHHPSLGWLKKFNVEVYFGPRKKYLVHAECRPMDVNYLKSLDLKWRSSYRIVEEPLDSLINQGVPFVSI